MAVRPFDVVFRDFVTDGVPATGPHKPYKPDIRDSLNALIAGDFPDNRVIKLNNANEGTPNEIIVSAAVDIPAAVYQVLYILNVTQENTGAVTVSGAINRTLVTNMSRPIEPGYLQPGMAVLCIDTGTELRLLSYGDIEKVVGDLVSRAEASEAAAELAKDQAQNVASDAVSQGNVPIYSTRNSVENLEIPSGISAFRTNGFTTVGDGGEALYRRVASEPVHPGKLQSADGAWWELGSARINVKMFGAKGGGVSDDTQAFKDAYQFFKTGTELQGGTIYIPRGHYKLTDEWLFEGVDHATNFWIEGEGNINTQLDFSESPAGKSGIILRGGSQIGIKKLLISGAKEHGLVLNDNYDHFVSQVTLSELRIQGCGGNGIYSRNSYLITLSDIWCTRNGGDGVGFYGNHTSIIGRRVYASDNGGVGHRINGAVYIEYNGQSDTNDFYGYWLSNIRSAVFNALGAEGNGKSGIYIQTGLHTDNIFPEYQGFKGVIFNAAFNLFNAADPTSPNSFQVETANGVSARLTVIGCEEDVAAGRPSLTLDASGGGSIEVSVIDMDTKSNIATAGSVKIKGLDSLFP